MTSNHQPEEEPGLRASEKLVRALARFRKEGPAVPPSVDETILRQARNHLRAAPPATVRELVTQFLRSWETRIFSWRRGLAWGAAAAALLLLGWAAHTWFYSGSASTSSGRPREVAQARSLDILDAFALARQIESGRKPGRQFDLNGDGVVDQRDVALLAARAVSLEKGAR